MRQISQIIHLFAQGGDVIESNPVFMTVVFKAFDTRVNKNNQRLSLEFLKRIADTPEFYAGTPVKVDADRLSEEMFSKLTHLYDEETKTFGADQIGSIQKFELREEEDGETSMYCTARIEKAKSEITDGIEKLFDAGELTFSYEIYGGDLSVEDGITVVTGSDKNMLTAMCVVSVPACDDAVAQTLIAEAANAQEQAKGSDLSASQTIDPNKKEKEEIKMGEKEKTSEQEKELRAERLFAQMEAPVFARKLHQAAIEIGEISWCWFPVAVFNDSTVYKNEDSGRMKRIYGREVDGVVAVDRIEEVEFKPIEKENPEEAKAEPEPDNTPEPVKEPEIVIEGEKKPEDEPRSPEKVKGEDDPDVDDPDDPDGIDKEDEREEQIRQLEEENKQLKERLDELEAQKAERLKAEADAKRQNLRAYAAERGMSDDEEMRDAIDSLDYERITQKLMASASGTAQQRNPFLSDGVKLGKTGSWRDLLHV